MPIIKVGTMTSAQLAAALTGLKTTLDSLSTRVTAALAAAGNSTPEQDAALAALQASVTALDKQVP